MDGPYIKSKIMQPIPQITDPSRSGGEAVELLDEQPFGVVDEARQLLHCRHAVRRRSDALLLRVHGLARLGEDVGVLGRREHAVEVRLAEAFAHGEDVLCGVRGREGQLCDSGLVCVRIVVSGRRKRIFFMRHLFS
jgi:hypothetical protein